MYGRKATIVERDDQDETGDETGVDTGVATGVDTGVDTGKTKTPFTARKNNMSNFDESRITPLARPF